MNGQSNGSVLDRRLLQTLAVQFVAAALTTAIAMAAWGYTIGRDVAVLAEKSVSQEKRLDRQDNRITKIEAIVWPRRGWVE